MPTCIFLYESKWTEWDDGLLFMIMEYVSDDCEAL